MSLHRLAALAATFGLTSALAAPSLADPPRLDLPKGVVVPVAPAPSPSPAFGRSVGAANIDRPVSVPGLTLAGAFPAAGPEAERSVRTTGLALFGAVPAAAPLTDRAITTPGLTMKGNVQ